jgi:cytochrome c oxidase assembly protein subunit 15
MHRNDFSARFAFFVCVLAWCVVMLGAYTRLKDAGLGCPDWPGCYGQIAVPKTTDQLAAAKMAYPAQPVEASKAWPEMVHRYFVGVLGLLILGLGVIAYRKRQRHRDLFILWLAIIAVVIFQAFLGKWTVTMRLLPIVVMGHLLGGMTLLSLLWLFFLKLTHPIKFVSSADKILCKGAFIALILVALQIFLGGWTSANYAALICPDFPLCRGQLVPAGLQWKQAFNFFMPVGQNFQGGILPDAARMTIQWMHRLGALVVFVYLSWFGVRCMRAKTSIIRYLGMALIAILLFQIILGTLNVVLMLPVFVAVLHNGVAAMLLLCVISLLHFLYLKSSPKIRS